MSRIGKKPVAIPAGVTASMGDGTLSVKGPKGELTMPMSDLISYEMKDEGLSVMPANKSKEARAFWGMQRTFIARRTDRCAFGIGAKISLSAQRIPGIRGPAIPLKSDRTNPVLIGSSKFIPC